MIKAFKYRLYPTRSQAIFFEKSFGCVRYVYNWALGRKIEAYNEDKTTLSWVDLCKELTLLKKNPDTIWLKEVNAQSLQQSIRNMDSAFNNFFKKNNGFPKFKSKKHSKASFQVILSVSIDFENNRIKLPKIGKVKFGANRTFDGKIGTCTISRTPTNKYYVSILVDDGLHVPEKKSFTKDTTVGIDVGIKDFAVLSNGQVFKNPKFAEDGEKRLIVLQRRMSRKVKGSNRWNRARLAVAKQYEVISNRRKNYLHQVTSMIVRENQAIVIEDLNVGGMMQNHNLAKHIASASWSEFFRQLQYKCEWSGKTLIKIGRYEPSSKMCLCGYINKDLTLKDRYWDCPSCGRHNDRDLVAAMNIKRFGLANLYGDKSPVVYGEEDVESLALAGAVKRQYMIV